MCGAVETDQATVFQSARRQTYFCAWISLLLPFSLIYEIRDVSCCFCLSTHALLSVEFLLGADHGEEIDSGA